MAATRKPMDEQAKAAAAAKARVLPSKEQGLFKELLANYEAKQMKKGIKAADAILKKHPGHGETLALKALVIHSSLPHNHPTPSSQPKGEEAEALIALALKKDPYSHITHHVHSIIARANKDWDTANVALLRAREIDPENIPLIRDSISLLTHLRKYDEAVEVRHRLFLLRPNGRSAWIGLAVGHELAGNYAEAIRVLEGLKDMTKSEGDGSLSSANEKKNFEIWMVSLHMRAGQDKEALELLEDNFRDRVVACQGEAAEMQARLLVKLGHTDEAEDAYRKLLEANPDKLEYYRELLKCRGLDMDSDLSAEQRSKVLFRLEGFAASYPRAAAPRRLALDVANDAEFNERVREYLIKGLERGVPSLFVDIKGLYGNAAKLQAVQQIAEALKTKLEVDGQLREAEADSAAPPTALLWLYYFLALHYSHPLHPSPDYALSLRYLDQAEAHTPTLPELEMARAMVLKRAGDPEAAARSMDAARSLDGQDRFVNGKAGKYWLRAGEVQKASDTFGLFTKKDSPTPGSDLTDMQCNWFLQEEGNAFLRAGRIGKALKRYKQVITIFQDYDDDQYDFHTYALRKATFTTYDRLMEYEDRLRADKNYFNAAMAATDILLRLHDQPDLKEVKLSPEEEAERKRAAKKAQKADSKAKKAAASDSKKEEQSIPDQDPDGLTLVKEIDELAELMKILEPLERLLPESVQVQSALFELRLRQGKHLRALQALCKASAVDPDYPKLHSQIVRFRLATDKLQLPAPVSAVIKAKLDDLIPESQVLSLFNSDFIQRHPSSPRHALQGCISMRDILAARAEAGDLAPSDKTQVEQAVAVAELTGPEMKVDLEVYDQAIAFLRDTLKSDASVIEAFVARVRSKAPLAMRFAKAEDLQRRREEWAAEEAAQHVAEPNGKA